MSTRMLLISHYLHDYNDFYFDLVINSFHTFVLTFLDKDYRIGFTLKSEIFRGHFLDFHILDIWENIIYVAC